MLDDGLQTKRSPDYNGSFFGEGNSAHVVAMLTAKDVLTTSMESPCFRPERFTIQTSVGYVCCLDVVLILMDSVLLTSWRCS